MKRKYISIEKAKRGFYKGFDKRTCKELKSNFLYWEVLDDFGEVLRVLHWYTPKEIIKEFSKTNRLTTVYLDVTFESSETLDVPF